MKKLKKIARVIINEFKKLDRKYRPKVNPLEAKKLHLGCGNIRLKDFCNVDILPTVAVDVVSDISKLGNFKNESIELIYACHVLEHFSHDEAVKVLKRWFEVIKPGGELRISVPDIDRIVKIYSKNWQHFKRQGTRRGLVFCMVDRAIRTIFIKLDLTSAG